MECRLIYFTPYLYLTFRPLSISNHQSTLGTGAPRTNKSAMTSETKPQRHSLNPAGTGAGTGAGVPAAGTSSKSGLPSAESPFKRYDYSYDSQKSTPLKNGVVASGSGKDVMAESRSRRNVGEEEEMEMRYEEEGDDVQEEIVVSQVEEEEEEEEGENHIQSSPSRTQAMKRTLRSSTPSNLVPKPNPTSLTRLLFLLASAAGTAYLSYMLYDYKQQSQALGYCDTSSDLNDLVIRKLANMHDLERCRMQQREAITAERERIPECETGGLTWYSPKLCTPCPEDGVCTNGELKECLDERIIVRNPILQTISPLFDGLPTFGPVAFPEKCLRNDTQDNLVMSFAKGIEGYLAEEKGRKICERGWRVGNEKDKNQGDGEGDAIKYGLGSVELLKAFWRNVSCARQ